MASLEGDNHRLWSANVSVGTLILPWSPNCEVSSFMEVQSVSLGKGLTIFAYNSSWNPTCLEEAHKPAVLGCNLILSKLVSERGSGCTGHDWWLMNCNTSLPVRYDFCALPCG